MRNFPHQFNDLKKLKRALEIINEMYMNGIDISDDGELGARLATAKVYTFRNKALSVAQALAREQRKPRASRGTETAARDIRRFFELSGLIAPHEGDSKWRTAQLGRALLAADDQLKEHAVWRTAMDQLSLTDDGGNISHPYRIMMRLVGDFPGIQTSKLMLALCAMDDSEKSYAKIKKLAKRNFKGILKSLGITDSSARNAVKILPAIARQLGDIETSKQEARRSDQIPRATEDGLNASQVTARRAPLETVDALTPTSAKAIAASRTETTAAPNGAVVDLSRAIALRDVRTKQHQECVRSIASVFEKSGYSLYEFPWDCLAVKAGVRPVLVEVKTLDGSVADERDQTLRALAQLRGYAFFDVPQDIKNSLIHVAAFSREPSTSSIKFLEHNGVCAIWMHGDKWRWLIGAQLGDFSASELPT